AIAEALRMAPLARARLGRGGTRGAGLPPRNSPAAARRAAAARLPRGRLPPRATARRSRDDAPPPARRPPAHPRAVRAGHQHGGTTMTTSTTPALRLHDVIAHGVGGPDHLDDHLAASLRASGRVTKLLPTTQRSIDGRLHEVISAGLNRDVVGVLAAGWQ